MFSGFSEQSIDFMWGIRLNNNREWFEAHKQEYIDHVQKPLKALGADVFSLVTAQYPDYGLRLKITRIYRDARRLHGRDPYKDHLWLSLERPSENWQGDPVFWFEIGPSEYSYGLGYYAPKAVTMEKFRKRLDTQPKKFLPLAKKLAGQSDFKLESNAFKKPKKAEVEPLLFDWYNSRGFSIVQKHPNDKRIFRPEFVAELAEAFCWLMPYYEYLAPIKNDPDPRG